MLALSLGITYHILKQNAEAAARARLRTAVEQVAGSASRALSATRRRVADAAASPAVLALAGRPEDSVSASVVARVQRVLAPLQYSPPERFPVELWGRAGDRLAYVGDPSTASNHPPLAIARDSAISSGMFTHEGHVSDWTIAPVRTDSGVIGYVAAEVRMGGRAQAVRMLRGLTGEAVTLHIRNADGRLWLGSASRSVLPPPRRDSTGAGLSFIRAGVGRTIAEEAAVEGSPMVAVLETPVRAVHAQARRAAAALAWTSLLFLALGVAVSWWISRRIALVDDARAEAVRLRAAAESAREAAERASRAKSDFLAVMSHELRTPLNAIGGYAQLLEMGVHGPVTQPQQDALRRIAHNQAHLLSLINDVLNYSKLDAGKVEYRVTAVSLPELLHELEPLVAPQIRAGDLRLELERCEHPLAASADRDKLQQILLNLLGNAAKFTPRGGSITVVCERSGASVLIHVLDTGIGIAQDRLQAIFDPFFQADRALSRPTEGVGLGLAISRDLARGMNGDLTVRSTPGEGSRFTVRLPAAQAALRQTA